ncbi:MAG: acyl-CoA thioesterase, partial [Planctomycetes bacterium]|nr:acyl-CoA thioesterase [Planctomycetota bacterium]
MDIRVYYEDTDSGGVVYYANYLRFFERDRTEYFRERGIGVAEYDAKGVLFVVADVEIAYRASAHHD